MLSLSAALGLSQLPTMGLCLPSGSRLSEADIDRVCNVIEATLDA